MQIDYKENAEVTSNIAFAKVTDMGFDEGAIKHLTSLMTNMYNDEHLAVIREYYTNAIDAHIAVGNTNPVKVILPTASSPVYVVIDEGIGMSPDDVNYVYSQYGASTKRESNEFNGAFGLGCKSALTIATQFTVQSVKNGMKTTAIISRGEDGGNKLSTLEPVETDAPNGTIITVPITDHRVFREKASKFFSYSKKGLVTVDGAQPEYRYEDSGYLHVPIDGSDAYMFLQGRYTTENWTVSMGNVGYSLDASVSTNLLTRAWEDEELQKISKSRPTTTSFGIDLVVPIGAVDLTPSREGLRQTKKTEAFIIDAYRKVFKNAIKTLQASIDASDNYVDGHAVYKKWRPITPYLGDLTWKGIKFIDQLNFFAQNVDYYSAEPDSRGRKRSTTNRFILQAGISIVTGITPDDYNKMYKYAKAYSELREDAGHSGDMIFVPSLGKSTLTATAFTYKDEKAVRPPLTQEEFEAYVRKNDGIEIVTLDKYIEKAKAYRKANPADRPTPSTPTVVKYATLDLKTMTMAITELPKLAGKKVAYLRTAELSYGHYLKTTVSNFASWQSPAYGTATAKYFTFDGHEKFYDIDAIVFLQKTTKADKLLEVVPTAISLEAYVNKRLAAVYDPNPNPVERLEYKRKQSVFRGFSDFTMDKFLDPRIKELKKSDKAVKPSLYAKAHYNFDSMVSVPHKSTTFEGECSMELIEMYDDYPMLRHISAMSHSKGCADVLAYCNSLYLAKNPTN